MQAGLEAMEVRNWNPQSLCLYTKAIPCKLQVVTWSGAFQIREDIVYSDPEKFNLNSFNLSLRIEPLRNLEKHSFFSFTMNKFTKDLLSKLKVLKIENDYILGFLEILTYNDSDHF